MKKQSAKIFISSNNVKLSKAIETCVANAERLLNDAQWLESEKPPATKYFLSFIAQEECAKAFLLHLVMVGAIPWNEQIYRATRDHNCKQLIGVLLDFLNPSDEVFDKRMDDWKNKGNIWDLSLKEKDAMNIFRHEKIGRWKSNNWVWAESVEWDKTALDISEGSRDRDKQDSLYVGLNKNGEVVSTPEKITKKASNDEYDRGNRFGRFVRGLLSGDVLTNADYQKIKEIFEYLFSEK